MPPNDVIISNLQQSNDNPALYPKIQSYWMQLKGTEKLDDEVVFPKITQL